MRWLTGVDLHGLRLSIVDEPARVERLRAIAIAGSELEMNTPRTHKESIDVVRIGSAEIAAHRDGISIKGPMIWMLRQLGEMTPGKAMTPGTMAWNSGRDYVLAGYASAPAFGWLASSGQRQGDPDRRRRAWVRLQLAAGALGVALQPHSQTLQEYPEMAALRAAMRAETGVARRRDPADVLPSGLCCRSRPVVSTGARQLRQIVTEPPLAFRIVNWIGIIDQLASTEANRVLRPLGLQLPQFVMLNHFSHRPDEAKTVTSIARALQQPQPGVTKTVQKLVAKGWLRERSSEGDGRSKLLMLTPAGSPSIVRPSRRSRPASSAPSPAGRRTIAVRCSRCSTA